MFHAQQAAGEVLDWGIDYRPKLDGATGLTSTWAISPSAGMTLYGMTMTAEQVTITVGSDQGGQIFVATNRLATDQEVLVESIEFYISP